MTPGMDGEGWVKRIAAEKARRHEPGTHVEKLMTARRMDPNAKAIGASFVGHIKMKRANVEPDGKSRSLGTGPSKPKRVPKVVNDPRRVMKEQPTVGSVKPQAKVEQKKMAEPKKPEKKTRIGQKLDAAKQNLKATLKKALPEKSIGKGERKVSLGNIKVKITDLGKAASRKLQEKQAKRRQNTREKAKTVAPPTRRR